MHSKFFSTTFKFSKNQVTIRSQKANEPHHELNHISIMMIDYQQNTNKLLNFYPNAKFSTVLTFYHHRKLLSC